MTRHRQQTENLTLLPLNDNINRISQVLGPVSDTTNPSTSTSVTNSQTGGEFRTQDPNSDNEDDRDADMAEKTLFPRFEGDSSKVKIESWLAMFELVHDNLTTDKDKVKKMVSYLKDGAMDWFSETIMPRYAANTINFDAIKTEMATRFNRDLVEPIIQVQNRKLKKDETVNEYFNDKLQILRRTGLKETGQIAMLTDGMPQHFRTPLISARPKDTNSWLSIALDLETSFCQNKKFQIQGLGPRVEAVHVTEKPNSVSQRRPMAVDQENLQDVSLQALVNSARAVVKKTGIGTTSVMTNHYHQLKTTPKTL